MPFTLTSITFIYFLALTLLVYYLIPQKGQWGCLLLASVTFIYLFGGLEPFVFLLIDIAVVYGGARLVEKTENPRLRRLALACTLVIIISVLFVGRYYNGMRPWVNAAFNRFFGFKPFWHKMLWAVPVGISYFSLSAIGYVLDVYWRTCAAQKNPCKLALLVTWFPALVSGPIVNYQEQSAQLFSGRRFDYLQVKFGFERMLWGFFKKLVIAERLACVTTPIFWDYPVHVGFEKLFAVLLYAYQIYADFSGCMDIVLGCSQMFGVSLPENFKQPFLSQNLSEFWRRWHITLGEWSKNYILYPVLKSRLFVAIGTKCRRALGKKRGKNVPTYIGLILLWVLIGIWHGGSATLIVAAGLLPALLLIGGQLLEPVFAWLTRTLKINKKCFSYRLFARLRTLALMCVIWLFATANSTPQAVDGFLHLFPEFNLWVFFDGSFFVNLVTVDYNILVIGFALMLAVDVLHERGVSIRQTLERQNLAFRWIVLLLALFSLLILGYYGPGADPADFIYGGF